MRELTEAELKVIDDVADFLFDLIEDEIRETDAEPEAVWVRRMGSGHAEAGRTRLVARGVDQGCGVARA